MCVWGEGIIPSRQSSTIDVLSTERRARHSKGWAPEPEPYAARDPRESIIDKKEQVEDRHPPSATRLQLSSPPGPVVDGALKGLGSRRLPGLNLKWAGLNLEDLTA